MLQAADCHAGPARTAPPTAASRRLTPVPCDADPDGTGLGLSALIEWEAEQLRQLSRHAGAHTPAPAGAPHHWQLLRFVLRADTSAPDEDATECYEVLHLSAPGLGEPPEGQDW